MSDNGLDSCPLRCPHFCGRILPCLSVVIVMLGDDNGNTYTHAICVTLDANDGDDYRRRYTKKQALQ